MLSLEVATPKGKSINFEVGIGYAGKYAQGTEVRLTSGPWYDEAHRSCDSPNTSRRFALGARDVCLVVKTRRAPSQHCRDATVNGHITTALHEISTPPPPPPLSTTASAMACEQEIVTNRSRSLALSLLALVR